MREIEFRCWNVEKKIMHNTAFPTWNGMIEVWRDNKPQTGIDNLSNGPELQGILMQYTGLKDKLDNDLYEGDLIKETNTLTALGEIYFDKGSFMVRSTAYLPALLSEVIERSEIERVGNVFENPELLK